MGERRLEVTLLGRSRFQVDVAIPITSWPRPSARRLTTLLVLAEDHRRRREELCELLFPHLPPERASRSVSRALSLARSVLGSDLILADRVNLWLNPEIEVACDLCELRELWRSRLPGPEGALAERGRTVDVANRALVDDPYEPWAQGFRDELTMLQRDWLTALARRTGDVRDWERLGQLDPASEATCRALIDAALRDGDRDAAVAAFERHRLALADLGLLVADDLAAAIHTDARSARTQVVASLPMRGRRYELDRVMQLLEGEGAASRGRVIVTGPAGLGKTRLAVEAVSSLMDAGWQVISGTAVPHDRDLPMAALRSALRQLSPAPRSPFPAVGVEGDEPPRTNDQRLAGLADVIDRHLGRAASTQPLLLFLDDVHWADPVTQWLIERLGARQPRPWGLLVCVRDTLGTGAAMGAGSHWSEVALRPLGREAAIQIIEDEAGSLTDHQVETVVRRAGGVPLYLRELARHGPGAVGSASPLPGRLRELLRERLVSLSPVAGRGLAELSLLGRQTTYEVLHAVDCALVTDPAALAELRDARLVAERGTALELAHPLIGEVVADSLSVAERGHLHVRLGEGLCAPTPDGAPPDEDLLAAAAHHLLRAVELLGRRIPEAAAAAVIGVRAGLAAARTGADSAARSLFERALPLCDLDAAGALGELGEELRLAWLKLGDLRVSQDESGSVEAYERARELSRIPRERVQIGLRRAWLPYRHGDLDDSHELLVALRATVGDDEVATAAVDIDLSWIDVRLGRVEDAVTRLEAATVVVEEAGEWWWTAHGLDRLADALADLGQYEGSLAVLARAGAAAARTGDRNLDAVVRMHTAGSLGSLGRSEEALRLAEGAIEDFRDLADGYSEAVTWWVMAEVLHRAGDLAGALHARDQEVALLVELANDLNLSGAQAHRVILLRALGRLAEAEGADQEAEQAVSRCGSSYLRDRIRDELTLPA